MEWIGAGWGGAELLNQNIAYQSDFIKWIRVEQAEHSGKEWLVQIRTKHIDDNAQVFYLVENGHVLINVSTWYHKRNLGQRSSLPRLLGPGL